VYLFDKFCEVKSNVGYWVLAKLQGQGEQTLVQVVVIDFPCYLLHQEESVNTLCELLIGIEFLGFSF